MLQIHLLGDFRLLADEQPLHLHLSPKEQALVVYLAWQGKPQARTALGQLFWEGRMAKQARSNLRTLLARSRTLLGDYLTVTREVIAFDESQEHWLDAQDFLRQLSLAGHLARQQPPGATVVGGRLMRALALYQDDFLAGFQLPGNERFMEWVEEERAALRGKAIHGWRRLSQFHEQRGDHEAALASCAQLLALDPFDEDAQVQILQLHRHLGRTVEALDHYERYRQQLDAELGLAPGDKLLAAYRELRLGPAIARPAPALVPEPTGNTPHDNVPAPLTPLIGRRRELAGITARFASSPARLVSLVGPGGIGKTHLALHAAQQLRGALLDGMVFVSLPEQLGDGAGQDALANALAHALNLRLHGRRSTGEQLLSYLRPREMLLLLDNVETALAESRSLILDLLQGAPDVRLLLTSREPLRIAAEELVVLDELPVPPASELQLAAFEEERYASLQLFVERARRTFTGFTLSEENMGDIARVCRLVGGIPLAIELAAAWVGHFNSAEIAEAIERNLSFLHSPLPGRPVRHQSMTNVFDYSWDLLVSHERRVLVQLALFQGRFSREAAQAVANAPLPVLMSLVNKSMLRLTGAGWYELHELVRRFAQAKWADVMGGAARASQEQRAVQLRYGRYYLDFIAAQADALHGPAPEKTIRAIQSNLDNISRAWQMMLALEEYDLVVQSANGLSRFFHFTGQYQAAGEFFAAAAEQLHACMRAGTGASPAVYVALARVQSKHAFYLNRLGQFEQASRVAQLAAATAAEVGDPFGQAESFLQWGEAIEMQGPLDIPRQKYLAALEIARAIRDQVADASRLEGRSLALLGRLAWRSGEIELADSYFQQALALERTRGDLLAEGHLLAALGANAELRGELREAEDYFRQAQKLYQQIHNCHRDASIQQHLGGLRFASGRYEEAAHHYQKAANHFRESGDHCSEGEALRALGELRLRQGRAEEARQLARQALAIAAEANDRRHASAALRLLGHNERFEGHYAGAEARFQEALALSTAVDDKGEMALLHHALGLNHCSLGQYDLAWHYCQAALQHCPGLVERVQFLNGLALVALALADVDSAMDYGQQGLQAARRVGLPALEARISMRVADAHVRRGEPLLATALYRRAITLLERTGEGQMAQEPRAALAQLYLEQGELHEACRHAGKALAFLGEGDLAGCEEPFRVYLTLYRVLQASGNARAGQVLQQAYEQLQLQAACIDDAPLRRLFLEQVPAHRAIVAALQG